MKRKACKTCRIFVEGDKCPICGNALFSTSWNGRVYVFDTAKSLIAQKSSIKQKGEYAVKVK